VRRFSGDTQPTEVLAEVGRNANLLIHEATMADDQAEMAMVKAHSTVGQAIEIGRKYVERPLIQPFVGADGSVRQDERGEDPFNSLFCSLSEDAPSNRRPEHEPDDSDQSFDSPLPISIVAILPLSHLRITRHTHGFRLSGNGGLRAKAEV